MIRPHLQWTTLTILLLTLISYSCDTTVQPEPPNKEITQPHPQEEEDTTPPLVVSSSILPPRSPNEAPYPNISQDFRDNPTPITGSTDVNPNTQTITVTFNEPIGKTSAISIHIYKQKHSNLYWEPTVQGNTLILTQLTPKDVKRILDETAIIEYQWKGTPLDTPAPDVKGEFVPVKVNIFQNLTPSTPLKPNTTYKLQINVTDKKELTNHIAITFKTRQTS